MARLPNIDGDAEAWGVILNEYLSVEHNPDGTQKTLSVAKGGTGATFAAAARANLGIASKIPVYIQKSNPKSPNPHLWIQTGIGPHGTGMTFWVEDGE